MNEIFPINGYPAKRYAATQAAFAALLARDLIERPITSIVETFAGMGGQTVQLAQKFLPQSHIAFERDAECHRIAGERIMEMTPDEAAGTMLCHRDYERSLVPFTIDENTLLVVDGAYTVTQHEDYVPFLHLDAGYLILCEQARARLHLHRKEYGVPEDASYPDYLRHVATRIGRPLLGYERTPYSPSYVLFGPTS